MTIFFLDAAKTWLWPGLKYWINIVGLKIANEMLTLPSVIKKLRSCTPFFLALEGPNKWDTIELPGSNLVWYFPITAADCTLPRHPLSSSWGAIFSTRRNTCRQMAVLNRRLKLQNATPPCMSSEWMFKVDIQVPAGVSLLKDLTLLRLAKGYMWAPRSAAVV